MVDADEVGLFDYVFLLLVTHSCCRQASVSIKQDDRLSAPRNYKYISKFQYRMCSQEARLFVPVVCIYLQYYSNRGSGRGLLFGSVYGSPHEMVRRCWKSRLLVESSHFYDTMALNYYHTESPVYYQFQE